MYLNLPQVFVTASSEVTESAGDKIWQDQGIDISPNNKEGCVLKM